MLRDNRTQRAWIAELTINRWILVLCCVALFAHTSQAGESLVYSISTGEMKQSQVLSKTEIFIVDPETGKQRLVFSDAGTGLLLLPGSDAQSDIVAAGGRIFSRGMERKLYSEDRPDYPAALYELSTDGSGKARKIFGFETEEGKRGTFRHLIISPTGAKIGYIKVSNGRPYLFVHETAAGKLLWKVDLAYIVFDSIVSTIGWMPDGERLFFTLGPGDEDDNWKLPESQMGSYVVKDNGSGPVRVAPEAAMHPSRPGLEADANTAAVVLGALPDGRYLVRDSQVGPASAHPGTYFYILDVAAKTQKTLRMDVQGELDPFRLSRSGRELALVAKQRQYETPGVFTDTKAVWVVDVESDKERKLLSFPIKQNGPPWIHLVGWLGDH